MTRTSPRRGYGATQLCWATPLYGFLKECEAVGLPKEVLDCGAGGNRPPLALFHDFGYETAGLEFDPEALDKAREYCLQRDIELNIRLGDMRDIPFDDASFSFVYSFNAIFFLTKSDARVSVSEMRRVLRPGGLCYVNFMSVDDPDDGCFAESSHTRTVLNNERFSKHADDEADAYFEGFTLVRKEKRIIDTPGGDGLPRHAYVDYAVRKNATG